MYPLILYLIREEASNIHVSIADFCLQQLKSMGKDAIMKKDLELSEDDVKDKDLLISLGMCKSHTNNEGTI